ncbi:MAG: hypothetical protein U0528_13535 [Anaerolineae bacterium]|nr:hypothetical protein [Anaerolineae bacterium]
MPDLQMDYEGAQDMVTALGDAADWFGQAAQHLRQVAEKIDAGALVHQTGQQWSETLRGRMFNGLLNAQTLLEELAKDVAGAMGDIQTGDQDGSNLFG